MMTALQWIAVTCVGFLGWTWIGYPVVIFCLSRLTPVRRSARTEGPLPSVAVIVATHRDTAATAARVRNLLDSAYPPALLHVIISVDSHAEPDFHASLEMYASNRVSLVRGDPSGGKAASVNAGVRAATQEVLVFTDVQQRFEADTVPELVAALAADPRCAVVGGALYLPGDAPGATRSVIEHYWAFERQLRAAEAAIHSSIGVSGSIYAMRRDLWVPMPPGLILDDVFVPMQQTLRGRRVGYSLSAKAWDNRATSAPQEEVRKVRTLTGNFQLLAWLPSLLIPWKNPVWLQFVSHKILRLLTPWLALALLLVGAPIAAVQLLRGSSTWNPLVLAALGSFMALVSVVPRTARPIRKMVSWGYHLNVALVRATANGLRKEWDVW
jgi:cellulose synthase/poly-beta-1,6-N-acetylglucosamine synthase-like glycosyltransferase